MPKPFYRRSGVPHEGTDRGTLIAFLLAAAAASFFSVYTFFQIDSLTADRPDAYRALLGAIAQAMAAVLAIVFGLSLVAAQLASRYSPRMFRHVLTNGAVAYMILFIFTTRTSSCRSRLPTGITMRPPGESCTTSSWGTLGAAAVTMMAS